MISSSNRRWWALGALTLSVLAVGLDATVLSVALPTLAGALHATESDLQWFQSGYLLVLAAAMLPAGLLGDRYGRKWVMLIALALFGAGSVACAYAPSAGWFTAARVVLGIAGAGVIVMALSALTVLFSKEERPKAVGVWAAANFLALPVGPILGGWLLSNYWWGWVFLMNVPVAVIGLIAGFALVPNSRSTERPRIDVVGVIMSSGGLVAVTYGLIEAGQSGWTDATALAPIAAGLSVLVAFFFWEGWVRDPLIDLALFRSRSFTWGVILMAMAGLALIGVLFALPQYFQAVLGTNAMGSGVRLLPFIAGMIAGVLPAERIARLIGPKVTVAAGFAVLVAGAVIGTRTGTGSGTGFIALWEALFGAGMGLVFATAASAALMEVPAERSGVGSAVVQAVQKVGGPFGAAIIGSVLSSTYQSALHLTGQPPAVVSAAKASVFGGLAVAHHLGSPALLELVRSAFVEGMDRALIVSAGIGVAGLLLALAFLPWRVRPASPVQNEEQVGISR